MDKCNLSECKQNFTSFCEKSIDDTEEIIYIYLVNETTTTNKEVQTMRIVELTAKEITRTIEQNKEILEGVERMVKENKEGLNMLGWSKTRIDRMLDCGDTELIMLKKKLGPKVARITGRW